MSLSLASLNLKDVGAGLSAWLSQGPGSTAVSAGAGAAVASGAASLSNTIRADLFKAGKKLGVGAGLLSPLAEGAATESSKSTSAIFTKLTGGLSLPLIIGGSIGFLVLLFWWRPWRK